jgi:hypothetical protein
MSPKISMTVNVGEWTPRSRRPIDKIRAAVKAVESQGIRICLDCDDGVSRHLTTGGWVADSRYRPKRVSIAGAVCLVLQPAQGLTIEEGAAAALDVSWDWWVGVLDGWQADAQSVLLCGASRDHYRDGMRVGSLLYAELTVECVDCGERRNHKEQLCRSCIG